MATFGLATAVCITLRAGDGNNFENACNLQLLGTFMNKGPQGCMGERVY